AHRAPPLVVAVLFVPARIAAGGLDVAAGTRADPDVGPGGRDDQLADAVQGRLVGDRLAVSVDVVEAHTGLAAADAWVEVADVGQAGGLHVLDRNVRRIARHDAAFPPELG